MDSHIHSTHTTLDGRSHPAFTHHLGDLPIHTTHTALGGTSHPTYTHLPHLKDSSAVHLPRLVEPPSQHIHTTLEGLLRHTHTTLDGHFQPTYTHQLMDLHIQTTHTALDGTSHTTYTPHLVDPPQPTYTHHTWRTLSPYTFHTWWTLPPTLHTPYLVVPSIHPGNTTLYGPSHPTYTHHTWFLWFLNLVPKCDNFQVMVKPLFSSIFNLLTSPTLQIRHKRNIYDSQSPCCTDTIHRGSDTTLICGPSLPPSLTTLVAHLVLPHKQLLWPTLSLL